MLRQKKQQEAEEQHSRLCMSREFMLSKERIYSSVDLRESILTATQSQFTLDVATYPSKVASTGVLQGEAANANVSPAKYACTPDGRLAAAARGSKLLKKEGSCNSMTSSRLRPIITAKPEAANGNPCPICPYAFPATEVPTPRSANVVANTSEKATEFPMTSVLPLPDPKAPMYPSVNGRTLSVHGERLVTRPAPKITAKLQEARASPCASRLGSRDPLSLGAPHAFLN